MSQQSSNKGTVTLLIILLLASIGFNFYQWNSKSVMEIAYTTEVDSISTAKADVEKELNDTYADLNKYKGVNAKLDSLLSEANSKVDSQKARIDQLIKSGGNSASLNKSLQRELDEAKKMRDEYMEKIDALLVENEQLKKDKTELNTRVDNLSKNLETTINTASVIKAEYFKTAAYKRKGTDKYAETLMAKRVNKLETCFSVMDNAIAKSGEKIIYLRMIEPGGKVLGNPADGSSTFKKTGSNEDLLFTTSQSLNYANQKQDLCLKYEEKERVFTPGTYLVEIYVDGNLAGTNSLNLK